jgi:hypothetical protein
LGRRVTESSRPAWWSHRLDYESLRALPI